MGDISEMMQDGLLCQECGGFNGVEKIKANGGEFDGQNIIKSPGFPITCHDCKREAKRKKYGKKKSRKEIVDVNQQEGAGNYWTDEY